MFGKGRSVLIGCNEDCPLCSVSVVPFLEGLPQTYYRCEQCELVWMAQADRLTPEEEYQHYLTHENDPADLRYRAFLGRLWNPLPERLSPGAEGLDYGSGPGPTLHKMAIEDGFSCCHYDPFFAPNRVYLDQQYGFITCSETAEHFHEPLVEFCRLQGLLEPGGWLGLMTVRFEESIDFADWYYRKDPTHVCFYTEATIRWLSKYLGFDSPVFVDDRVVLLRKV